jgi:hypothetical protein
MHQSKSKIGFFLFGLVKKNGNEPYLQANCDAVPTIPHNSLRLDSNLYGIPLAVNPNVRILVPVR